VNRIFDELTEEVMLKLEEVSEKAYAAGLSASKAYIPKHIDIVV